MFKALKEYKIINRIASENNIISRKPSELEKDILDNVEIVMEPAKAVKEQNDRYTKCSRQGLP